MQKKLCVCLFATVMFSLCFSTVARAAITLGFDDITPVYGTPPSTYVFVPDGYGGLNWGTVAEGPLAANAGHPAFDDGVVSPNYAAIFGIKTYTIWNPGGTFDFVGAYFTGGWSSKTAPVQGYLGDNQIYTASVAAPNGNPTWHQFDWTGIDKLVFPVIQDGGTEGYNDDYVVDDFTIDNVSSDSVVPEPSTFIIWSLLGAIGVGVGSWRRRAA